MYWLLSILMLLISAPAESLQVSGLTYLNTFKPGETAKVSVMLISDKDTPELVDLKLCDYWCNSEGQHFFEETGKQPRSNASWITLGSARETINPGDHREIFFTINVPKDASLKGSYWSVLLIEPSDPIQTLVESKEGFQLQVKVRYAYHIVTNIGNGTPSVKIVNKEIQQISGKQQLAVDALNTGELFLNPKMTVKVFSKQGKLEKTSETQTDRLYPGSSVRYLADAEGLQAGNYTAFLLFDNGDGKIFGDSFQLTVP